MLYFFRFRQIVHFIPKLFSFYSKKFNDEIVNKMAGDETDQLHIVMSYIYQLRIRDG